jgi:hypothetical protein
MRQFNLGNFLRSREARYLLIAILVIAAALVWYFGLSRPASQPVAARTPSPTTTSVQVQRPLQVISIPFLVTASAVVPSPSPARQPVASPVVAGVTSGTVPDPFAPLPALPAAAARAPSSTSAAVTPPTVASAPVLSKPVVIQPSQTFPGVASASLSPQSGVPLPQLSAVTPSPAVSVAQVRGALAPLQTPAALLVGPVSSQPAAGVLPVVPNLMPGLVQPAPQVQPTVSPVVALSAPASQLTPPPRLTTSTQTILAQAGALLGFPAQPVKTEAKPAPKPQPAPAAVKPANPVQTYLAAHPLRYVAAVFGPIDNAVFAAAQGDLVLSLGQTLPNSQIVVQAITSTQVILELGTSRVELRLARR